MEFKHETEKDKPNNDNSNPENSQYIHQEPKRIPRITGAYYHEDLLDSRNLEQKRFMSIKLNYGISRLNFVAFLIMNFTSYMCMSILLVFANFILEDERYYGLTKEQLAIDVG